MKKMIIMTVLAGAALISCQQQQQQVEVTMPIKVLPLKK
jgi:hypothetical protein